MLHIQGFQTFDVGLEDAVYWHLLPFQFELFQQTVLHLDDQLTPILLIALTLTGPDEYFLVPTVLGHVYLG